MTGKTASEVETASDGSSASDGNLYYSKSEDKELKLHAIPIKDFQEDLSKHQLILIPIHSESAPRGLLGKKGNAPDVKLEQMPDCYQDLLKKFCPECVLLSDILWRNVQMVESRYESRFRSRKEDNSACFLHFHTLQAPVLADLNVTLAMVDHLKISNNSNKHEHIIAFIYVQRQINPAGQESTESIENTTDITEKSIEEMSDSVFRYYVEKSPKNPGFTPMLFIAALLKWYGFDAKDAIAQGFNTLTKIDRDLMKQVENLSSGDLRKQAGDCRQLNKDLTSLNKSLTGLRSRVNYVAESARSLKNHVSRMKKYILAEIKGDEYKTDGPCSRKIIKNALKELENPRFMMRDTDKFDMIERAMQQYHTDIKSLKAHLAINIGLVSNLYAQLLTEKATRENAFVVILTSFGAILLPTTFSCIVLTSPIVKFKSTFHESTFRYPPLVCVIIISIFLWVGFAVVWFIGALCLGRKKASNPDKNQQSENIKSKEDSIKKRTNSMEMLPRQNLRTSPTLESGRNYLSESSSPPASRAS